jgi:hypothetical protein
MKLHDVSSVLACVVDIKVLERTQSYVGYRDYAGSSRGSPVEVAVAFKPD